MSGAAIEATTEATCARCRQTKPADEFFAGPKKNGLQSYCKQCNKAAHDEWVRRNRPRHKALLRRYTVQRYGITLDEYDQLLSAQFGRCAICSAPPPPPGKTIRHLCIDHDHDHCPTQWGCRECIRGLLCVRCNSAVGRFQANSPEWQDYIAKPRPFAS